MNRVTENLSTKKKIKYLDQLLNEREMFKVLFWFQINNMWVILKVFRFLVKLRDIGDFSSSKSTKFSLLNILLSLFFFVD